MIGEGHDWRRSRLAISGGGAVVSGLRGQWTDGSVNLDSGFGVREQRSGVRGQGWSMDWWRDGVK